MAAPASGDDRSARLARASGAVSGAILLSRLAGLLREKLLAYHFGTGLAAEAFRAALRIPNLLQNLLGDGVLSGAFVPTYARMLRDGREEAAGRLAGAVASLLVLVTGLLVVVGVVLAGPLTRLLTPGFPVGSAKAELTVMLVRILTPSLGFLVLSAWSLGVLNAHRRFFRAYVAPVLWNATIIIFLTVAATFGLSDVGLVRAVAFGALTGAVVQFLFQLPAVLRCVPLLRMRVDRDVPGLRDVLGASSGVIAGRGIVQLSAYLDLALASLLAAGAVAALGYAQVLYLLPVSLFGMSVASAALPDLATVRPEDRSRLSTEVDAAMSRIATFVIPTTVLYLVLGEQVVTVLFGGGAFGALATRQVALVLAAYSIGLVATTQSRLMQSTLYGLDDTRTPARIAAARVTVATVMGVGLMLMLDAYQVTESGIVPVAASEPTGALARAALGSLHRLGAVGLALGASLGAWAEWVLLRRAVARRASIARPRSRALRPSIASLAIIAAVPLGGRARSALGPVLDGAPVALGGAVALLVALLLFVCAAVVIGLDDLPGVGAIRRLVRDRTGHRRRSR